MAKNAELWGEVAKLAAEGKDPVITLPPGSRIVIPKRPGPGRPRVIPVGEKAWWTQVMKTPKGHPMRCRNVGCNKQIGRQQHAIVCSPRCKAQLLQRCKIMLDILEGRLDATELPPHMRTQLGTSVTAEKREQRRCA